MRNISCTWKKGKVLQGRMTMFGCWWWKWTVSTELTMSVTCLNPIQCYQKLSSSILKVEEQEQGSVVSLSILYSIYSMYSMYSISYIVFWRWRNRSRGVWCPCQRRSSKGTGELRWSRGASSREGNCRNYILVDGKSWKLLNWGWRRSSKWRGRQGGRESI